MLRRWNFNVIWIAILILLAARAETFSQVSQDSDSAKYKKFLARNGFNPEDILADKIQDLSLSSHPIGEDAPVSEETLKTLAESLRREQLRASALEADLYVLQIDYDTLIKMKTSSAS